MRRTATRTGLRRSTVSSVTSHRSPTTQGRESGLDPSRRSAFGAWVRDALLHLYDLTYLQTHSLAHFFRDESTRRPLTAGEALQQHMIALIGRLCPLTEAEATPKVWRRFRLMSLRYTEGKEVAEVCGILGISQSEYY